MPRFELRVLGSPHILAADGTTVDLPLGKPLAALCFVALEPSSVQRSDLARFLWPSSTEPRARASIRQALWLIRKETDPAVVVERDGVLVVDGELLSTDLTTFEDDLAAGRLHEAFTRWNGGPFMGFAVSDAPDWMQWAEELRSRWESHLGRALEDRAAAAVGAERTAWLERAAEVWPYRPELWLRLVEAHVDLRDLESAERALGQLRAVVDSDDPGRVRSAEERVRLLRRSAFDDVSDHLVPEFVGRATEFAQLMSTWRAALSGRPSVVGIVGAPGVGKTALAAEALRHCEGDGATVLEIGAVRTESHLEYGVVTSLAAELLRRPGAAGTSAASAQTLQALVPSEASAVASRPPRPPILADALADLLAAVAHESALVVLIDDAHWIDPSSAIVVLRAVRTLRDSPVLLLLTCRTGEPDNAGIAALRDALRTTDARRIELAPLGPGAMAEMVGLLLTGSDPGRVHALAGRIHQRSGGVPLHAVELLQDLRDREAIGVDHKGRWMLTDDAEAAVVLPETLEDTQEDRIERLGAHGRRLGTVLAQAAGPLGVETLQARSGLSVDDCTKALAGLFARDLVRWTRDDEVALRHQSLAPVLTWRGGDEPTSPRRLSWWIPTAAIAVLAAAGLWALSDGPVAATEAGAPAYGGGTLLLRSADSILMLQPGAEPGGLRRVGSQGIPDGLVVSTAALHRSGDLWMGGSTLTDLVAPPAAVVWNGSSLDTLIAIQGDASTRILRPQGDAVLLQVQHPDTSIYRAMVVRKDLVRGDTAVLSAGESHYAAVSWYPDGRRILVLVDNTQDSLRVIDPSGRVLEQIEAPSEQILGVAGCGDGALMWAAPPAQTIRLWLWSLGDAEPRMIDLGSERFRRAACSPDGTAVALIEVDGEEEHLVVRDLDGAVLDRAEMTGRGVHYLEWLPPAEPAPVSVEVSTPNLEMERGARRRVDARVLDIDRREVGVPLQWVSAEPAVASVRADGTVMANRPGRTSVSARVDGWLADSLWVTVLPGDSVNALTFVDSFPRFDPAVWTNNADSAPVAVRTGGRSALRLNGDGRYRDAIDSVEEFDLSRGGTVEILFRLEAFSRRDRQRIQLCLNDGETVRAPADRVACVTWPAFEGFDFDPDAVWLTVPGGVLGKIPVGGLLATGEWSTLGLQVRADGTVSAVVNDSIVAVHPAPLRMAPEARFHISVLHAAVDTELLLREVSVWTEERYR